MAIVRLLLLGALAVLAQIAFASEARAATIEANPGSLGSIPDNPGPARNVTFDVDGFTNGSLRDIGIDIGLQHPYVGDLKAVLISPLGESQKVVFSRTGFSAATQGTDDSGVSGIYRFSDRAPVSPTWWETAAAVPAGGVIPPDNYRASIPGGDAGQGGNTSLFNSFAGNTINGTWTLQVSDLDAGLTGSVTSAALHIQAIQAADLGSLGPIPDSTSAFPGTFNAPPRDVKFTIDGLSRNPPQGIAFSLMFSPGHTQVGNLDLALIAPDGTQKTIFSRTGAATADSSGSNADLQGSYLFQNGGDSWWSAAAANASGTLPAGNYAASLPGPGAGRGDATSITAGFAGITNPNGVWTLRFRDGQIGDTGSVSAATLRLIDATDITPPSAPNTISTNPGTPSNSSTPSVIGIAEAGSTVRLYRSASCSGIQAVSGPASEFGDTGIPIAVQHNQTTMISARTYDSSGNVSNCETTPLSYTEDSNPPVKPTISEFGEAADFNNPAIHGSGAEAGSQVAVFESGDCSSDTFVGSMSAAVFNGSGIDFHVDDDTATSFSTVATDQAGNQSVCSDPVIYVEDSSAELNMSDTEPASPSNANSPLFFGDTEPGASVELFKTDDCSGTPAADGTAEELSVNGLVVGVPDNSKTQVRGVATDALGHVSPCSNAATYIEDSKAPRTTIRAKPRETVTTKGTKAKFRITFKSSEPRSSFRCKLDRESFKTCKSPLAGKVKSGKHTVLISATDAAHNTDKTPAKVSWKVKKR